MLEADPTVIYAHDTAELAKLPRARLAAVLVLGTDRAAASPTTRCRPTSPPTTRTATRASRRARSCTPTVASIDAALEPDTSTGYLYFVAKGDGSGTSAFAKTFKEHQANIAKYLKKP